MDKPMRFEDRVTDYSGPLQYMRDSRGLRVGHNDVMLELVLILRSAVFGMRNMPLPVVSMLTDKRYHWKQGVGGIENALNAACNPDASMATRYAITPSRRRPRGSKNAALPPRA